MDQVTKTWSKRQGIYELKSIEMDDSTVTETWVRREEGKGDNPKKKAGKTDDAGKSAKKERPSVPKRPAARTFQSSLSKRARKGDDSGKKGK